MCAAGASNCCTPAVKVQLMGLLIWPEPPNMRAREGQEEARVWLQRVWLQGNVRP